MRKMSVAPVKFENRDGYKLFGMLHKPEGETHKPAIVLLSPGVKMRVAPHRLYVNMTRRFVELGFVVFRFDFYALGDAEGNLNERWLADVYNSVALGRYINDTTDALNWLEKETGISNYIIAGLCGGALTGLLAGQVDQRIVGLLGLGIPVVLDSSESDRTKNITKGELNELRSGYFRNLLSFKSWMRLLTFKSDFKVIFRALGQMIGGSIKKKNPVTSSHSGKPSSEDATQTENNNSNINPLFSSAFFSMLESSRNMMLVFSGADRLYWEFDEKFSGPNQHLLSNYNSVYEVHTVKDANHIFSNKAWQEEMLQLSNQWLVKYFT